MEAVLTMLVDCAFHRLRHELVMSGLPLEWGGAVITEGVGGMRRHIMDRSRECHLRKG